MSSPFHLLDWLVFAAYGVGLAVTGWLVAHRPKDSRDYFVGHGHLPAWAVAISVLASALSVATYLGAPQEAFAGNLTYLMSNLGTVLAVLAVAFFFVPAFYRRKVVTVYELLGHRFGQPAAMASSWTFLVGRTLASGARLYMAAIPMAMILFGDQAGTGAIILGISVLTVVATVYTLAGGIHSIIWTDVIQFVVMIGAVIAALCVLVAKIPADWGTIWQTLAAPLPDGTSKLTVLDTSFDLSKENTLFTALTGYLLLNFAAYGTDQDLAQRMLTCKNAVAGGRSAIYAIIINLPVVALFMAMGLLLWIFFQVPALMGAAAPAYQPGSLRAFLAFILHEMPPGLAGLMMAGLFAIALTSLLSAINAMASAFVTDCYRHAVKGRPDAHYLFVSRAAVVGAGLVLGLMAVVCIKWQRASGLNLLGFAFNVMVLTSSGLLGVFLAAVFTTRGSWWTAIAALATAFVVALFLQPNLVTLWMPDCWPSTWTRLAWPWRMVIGTAVSFGVCCLVPAQPAGKTDGPG